LKYSPATWKTSLLSKLPQKFQKNKQNHCSIEKTEKLAFIYSLLIYEGKWQM
jgi:hypothetical protein